MKCYTITETAVVVAEEPANSGKYLLELASQEIDKERCATCRMCGDRAGKKVLTAVLGKDVDKSLIVPGAKVQVEIKIPLIYTHILFVFVLPIIGFMVGASVGYALAGGEGVRSLLTVGLGFVGAVSLFLAGKPLFGKKVTQREDPVIVAAIPPDREK